MYAKNGQIGLAVVRERVEKSRRESRTESKTLGDTRGHNLRSSSTHFIVSSCIHSGQYIARFSLSFVADPASDLTILGYQEESAIRAGSLLPLTCVVHGGNPLPELKWFRNDEELTAGLTSLSNGSVVTSELA